MLASSRDAIRLYDDELFQAWREQGPGEIRRNMETCRRRWWLYGDDDANDDDNDDGDGRQ